ncbi:MAG: rhamnogalacturonan acetylesterase [Bacteroides sp.]|nr:rhamnogalacturonan acetylesterase [Bacteroides sp.]
MRSYLFFTWILLWILCGCTSGPQPVRIHILGDSTTEHQNPNLKAQRGWPQFLHNFLPEGSEVLNHGKSGTSTKTFYHHGFWQRALPAIEPGDYVFIQFAHNDEKHDGFDGEIGTLASDSFPIYLNRYVDEVQQRGAHPVLVTPMVRKMFDQEGRVSRRGRHDLAEHIHQRIDTTVDPADTITYNYVYQMKRVAQEREVLLIDMTTLTENLVNAYGGQRATQRIYNVGDGTHIGAEGAALFSRLIAEEMRDILPGPGSYVPPATVLLAQPARFDYGDIYRGMSRVQAIDIGITGDLSDQKGTEITVHVTGDELTVSDTPDGEFGKSLVLQLPATEEEVSLVPVYVKAAPGKTGGFRGELTMRTSGEQRKLLFTGHGLELAASSPIQVSYPLHNDSQALNDVAVIGSEQQRSQMELQEYLRPADRDVPSGLPPHTKAQFHTIAGGIWPRGEMDVDYNRYIEFAVEAAPGTRLRIQTIELNAGGGVSYRIACSHTPDFSTATVLGERNDGGADLILHRLETLQEVAAGEKLYLRIYPWNHRDQENNAALCLQGVVFHGIQETE